MSPIPQEDVFQRLDAVLREGVLGGRQPQEVLFFQTLTWPPLQPFVDVGPVDVSGWRKKSVYVLVVGQQGNIDIRYSLDGGVTLYPLKDARSLKANVGEIFSWSTEDVISHLGLRVTGQVLPPSSFTVLILGG